MRPRHGPGRPVLLREPEAEAAPVKPERSLTRSAIYEVDLSRGWAGDAAPDDSLADRLRKVLRDRKFHAISEIKQTGLSAAECVSAMVELISQGHVLDRVDAFLRLRMRSPGTARQDLQQLLDGLDLSDAASAEASADRREAPADLEPEFDLSNDVAGVSREEASTSLVLSDPPSALTLPAAESCGRTAAILAQRGAGKTYLGGVLVEEMTSASSRFSVAIIDPNGVWWGLLAGADGSPSRAGFLLLGGPRGCQPLRAQDGGRAAELVAAVQPRPVILDLSGLAPVEQHEFVAGFCARLLAPPHFPIHVVFDEADEFCPQRLREPGQKLVLAQVERLVMRGRSRGIGATLISLRPAVISKNVLSQVDSLYLLRLVEANDLRAVGEWLDNFERGITPEQRAMCMSQLPVLPSGTSYFLRGGDSVMFRRFRVRRKRSYDSSRTLVVGARDNAVLAEPDAEVRSLIAKLFAAGEKA